VNIMNKQLQTVNKGWSSSLGFGCGADNPFTVKNYLVMKCFKVPQTWTDSLA
jgi:hypothetical protein